MTIWQKIALGLGDALDGVTGGLFKAFLRLFGVDLDALRAQAEEERRQQDTAEADRAERAAQRAEDVALQEQTLAALLDLRADLKPTTSWESPEPRQVDSAVAAERRTRHAAIKAASEVVVRSGDPVEPEVDPVLTWRVA